MIWNATDELRIPPKACWFVGDTPRRDIVCARRADVGLAILMRSARTEAVPDPPPDEIIEDGFGLETLLRKSFL